MPGEPSVDTVRRVLFTVLETLQEYLSEIVIVGGWVPKIYSWQEKSEEMPVHSFDVDAAVAGIVHTRGRKSIPELMKDAGFEEQTTDSGFALGAFGKKVRHTTCFLYRKGHLKVPIEFIAPLEGRGEDTQACVQSGLVVPALRFVGILLEHTSKVSVEGETLDGKKKRFTFRVPSLSAYVYSKGLIFPRRRDADKKGKDLAYIYEILLRPHWRKEVLEGIPGIAVKYPTRWFQTFKNNFGRAFETQGSQGPAWIALQFPNRPAEEVRRKAFAIFQDFLGAID